ncbi:uncharacterized protein LOC117190994 isoform X1 [Drosophila miranda]|uniref:uncharacterized protein LOC117190994 isoform X1 n=1 Tax=Drosophila miranda TaxID=7229 RepID=UPI00143FB422|nr:uncharacterized protein LOC117190994 isoform X1 [Drosophila miranda]
MEKLILKLPVQQRLEWARHSKQLGDEKSTSHLSLWLQGLAEEVQDAGLVDDQATFKPKKEKSRLFHANDIGLVTMKACSVCNGKHDLENCNSFAQLELEKKWLHVRERKLCFNCLKYGHRSQKCRRHHQCGLDGCAKRIHRLLHAESVNQPGEEVKFTGTATHEASSMILFKILPVNLHAKNKIVRCHAFLDEGSAVTLINESLADELGLHGPKESLTLQWFGEKTSTELVSRFNIGISDERGGKVYALNGVRTIKDLRLPKQSVNMSELSSQYPHIKSIPLKGYRNARPEILIGLDNLHLIAPKQMRSMGYVGPAIALTNLGWVAYGKCRGESGTMSYVKAVHLVKHNDEHIEQLVRDYITNTEMDVRIVKNHVEGRETERSNRLLSTTTKRIGDRFETGLLWKVDDVVLPDSKKMAIKRQLSLERKFIHDPECYKKYCDLMEAYEEKSYIRHITSNELEVDKKKEWFLPHFGVLNPNKPGKLRIVFDAAAEVDGVSLNSMLMTGPDGYQSLTDILMRFRQKPIGVCADIAEMFHQVIIRKEDRCAQRILWRKNPGDEMKEYEMQVMTFGAKCSPASAQYVKNRNALEFKESYPDAVNAIIKNHYVDDLVHCFSSEESAVRVVKEIVDIHKKGGFELRKFVSNSKFFNKVFGNEQVAEPITLDRDESSHYQKVLGMYWCTRSDEFGFSLSFNKIDASIFSESRIPSKREVLRVVMSVFDPFGILAEYSLIAKLLLQSIWQKRTEWDQPIEGDDIKQWKCWLRSLSQACKIRIPRCYAEEFFGEPIELHIFCDE